jgi:hypothetical protein
VEVEGSISTVSFARTLVMTGTPVVVAVSRFDTALTASETRPVLVISPVPRSVETLEREPSDSHSRQHAGNDFEHEML